MSNFIWEESNMRQFIITLLCIIGIQVYAAGYAPFDASAQSPVVSMCSVNNATYMSSGSAYSSSVTEVGASDPTGAPGRGIRRAGGPGGTGGTSDYDPQNPQFAPIGDALIPLLLMAVLYTFVSRLRRRKVS